ncbi:MAG: tRNA epoxyqueuosine(34) reductase QueG [Vulcanimicrobiaceae bacterium]
MTDDGSPAALAALVRRVARAAGASRVAICTAERSAQTYDALAASFARGDLATWGYDDTYASKASDPQTLLCGARSVVAVAVAYARADAGGTPGPTTAPLAGRVSNYAWSSDYHPRLRALLTTIASALDERAGAPVTRIACDTAPLAERAFARAAGLGWVGKHTNLIAPGAGSFVFLGEVVTSLALAPDAPLRKTCGSCARCVTACPTGALRGDYTIDATRCISDLTQRTDAIPRELRPLVGDWVWGCDLCQLACPPTRLATAAVDPAFDPPDAQAAAPSLLALLAMRSSTFKRRYRATAMGWRGAAVLRRNAAVALGNAGDRAAVPALERALREDPHPLVRGHVAWALGRIGSPPARRALAAGARDERDASVCEEIAAAQQACAGNHRPTSDVEAL